jgi:hypothetical protein
MTDLDTINEVLAIYRSRMAAIQAINPSRLNYVLSWGDGRYVRLADDRNEKPGVTGYEHATFFGDREAARAWLKAGLTDGRGEAPHMVNAFNAKQGALHTLQRIVNMVEAQAMLKVEGAE